MTSRNFIFKDGDLGLSSSPSSPLKSPSTFSSNTPTSSPNPFSLVGNSPASSNTTAISPPLSVEEYDEEVYDKEMCDAEEDDCKQSSSKGVKSKGKKPKGKKSKDKTSEEKKRGRGRPRTDDDHPRWIPFDKLKTEKDPAVRAELQAELDAIDKVDRDAAKERRKVERQAKKAALRAAEAAGGKVGPTGGAKPGPKAPPKKRGRKVTKGKEPVVALAQDEDKEKSALKRDSVLAIPMPPNVPLQVANAMIPVGEALAQDVADAELDAEGETEDDEGGNDNVEMGDSNDVEPVDSVEPVEPTLPAEPTEPSASQWSAQWNTDDAYVAYAYNAVARQLADAKAAEGEEKKDEEKKGEEKREEEEEVIEDGSIFGPPMRWLDQCGWGVRVVPKRLGEIDDEYGMRHW
ncbi:hypothetical protein FB567DRAFT_550315 [Paraphoma chrysanthemicola]|uniref:Uncharacterized protein n=1 Tax=Paraphoma chrysanthemicola TaxID=798071 RepID=A0A8K0VXM1_9PLEO|nr:hypothetical protein FB567DRAFT_550315 [Paraphoma chrysanthemicola]